MTASMRFSNRVRNHPRVFAFQPQANGPIVLAVVDQLLVCISAWERVKELLAARGIQPTILTTLLDGLVPAPGVEDVNIVRVALPQGADIVTLTRDLRASLQGDEVHKVSPNHVLIPASAPHGCPWGPPHPIGHGPKLAEATPPFVQVGVVDSGYQWDATWGDNPLSDYGVLTVGEADWLGPSGWEPGTPERLDADSDGRLDALAGHANFVAGLVAQRCEHAQITILSHNGGFHPDSDDFPTEAAVARSLCKCAGMAVVDLGFAFLSLDDMISCVWEAAYAQLAGGTVVVAPAGNQASPIPRFPAALDAAAPGTYPNILAVGSIDGVNDDGSPHPSEFSNRGPWVSCSARGGNAHSTFLRVDMPVEEDPAAEPVSRDFTKSAWAAWNGTSFATPEVVAAIATATTSGTSPAAATKAVLGTGTPDPAGLLGIVLANV